MLYFYLFCKKYFVTSFLNYVTTTDNPSIPGNSGSAVFDDSGYLVGITQGVNYERGMALLVPLLQINMFLDKAPKEFKREEKKFQQIE